jgi:hypothetical protein
VLELELNLQVCDDTFNFIALDREGLMAKV